MIVKNIFDYIKINISGVTCYLYNRPTNSTNTDLVVSQVDDVIRVEVFANNVGNDKTFPNFTQFSLVEAQLSNIIPFSIKRGELQRNSNGYWSQIFEFKAFKYGNGTQRVKSSVNDGYGGVTAVNVDNPCVCFVENWNLQNERVDIAINKAYVPNSSILFDDNEFVVQEFKTLNENFTLCLTYRKSHRV